MKKSNLDILREFNVADMPKWDAVAWARFLEKFEKEESGKPKFQPNVVLYPPKYYTL